MTAKTIAALAQLDPKNDAHWTGEGFPRLETVRLFSGDSALSREQVTAAAPGFSRANPVLATSDQATPDAVSAAPAAAQPAALGENSDGKAVQPGTGDDNPDDEAQPAVSVAETPIEAARAALAVAIEGKAKADQVHAKAVAALDAELDAAVSRGTRETLADQVGAYHKRQLEALHQRGEQKQRLKAANIDLKELFPQASALDKALSRKNTRGAQRPNVPLR